MPSDIQRRASKKTHLRVSLWHSAWSSSPNVVEKVELEISSRRKGEGDMTVGWTKERDNKTDEKTKSHHVFSG